MIGAGRPFPRPRTLSMAAKHYRPLNYVTTFPGDLTSDVGQ